MVVVLLAGDQVPLMPSLELPGRVKLSPLQVGPMGSKVGVTFGVTVTVKVVVLAHSPAAGVKV